MKNAVTAYDFEHEIGTNQYVLTIPLLSASMMLSASVFPDCCRKAKTYNAAVAMSQHIETADSLYYTKESAVLRISLLLLVAGLEPARCCHRGILSPLRLPIPPHQLTLCTGQVMKPCHIFYAYPCGKMQWMEVDSNHRSNLQQIYSLSPLATRESIHKKRINALTLAIVAYITLKCNCILQKMPDGKYLAAAKEQTPYYCF